MLGRNAVNVDENKQVKRNYPRPCWAIGLSPLGCFDVSSFGAVGSVSFCFVERLWIEMKDTVRWAPGETEGEIIWCVFS